jgi:hypothetical protein
LEPERRAEGERIGGIEGPAAKDEPSEVMWRGLDIVVWGVVRGDMVWRIDQDMSKTNGFEF